MRFPYQITNKPFLHLGLNNYAYEVWYWKLNPINESWSFWFRFTLLKNALKDVAEIWGIFSKKDGNTAQNTAIKQTFSMGEYNYQSDSNRISIQNNYMDFNSTSGTISNEGARLEWNLNLMPIAPQTSHNFIPVSLWKLGIVKNYAVTTHEKILFNGLIRVNEETFKVENALGMQGHLAGVKQGHSWAWAHSCIFYDEETSESFPLIIDILTARAQIGKEVVTPALSTLFFHYDGRSYSLNTVCDIIKTKSSYLPLYWEFKTSSKDLQILGTIEADINTLVGVQYEDTDGSFLYCYNTKMATMKLRIYDKTTNKERQFISPHKCAFEWVQRELWDKVPISI